MKRYVSLLHIELTLQDNFFRVIYNGESVKWVFCIFTQVFRFTVKFIGSQVRDRDLLNPLTDHTTLDYLTTELPIEMSGSL